MKTLKTILIIAGIIALIWAWLSYSNSRYEKLDAFWTEQEKHCPVAHIYENNVCIHVDDYENR